MALERTLPRPRPMPLPSFSTLSFVALNLLGVLAYLHPFISAGATHTDSRWFEHNTDAPLIFAAVAALSMLLIVAELTTGGLNSKSLAVLGVLSALAAVLRTITLPAGANLYFFLVILGAYAFGPRLGFLLGALSFFLSAVVTGGVGPWLPFQMFASAWMGLGGRVASAHRRALRTSWPRGARHRRGIRGRRGVLLRGSHEPLVLAVLDGRPRRHVPARDRCRRGHSPLLELLPADELRVGCGGSRLQRHHHRARGRAAPPRVAAVSRPLHVGRGAGGSDGKPTPAAC